MNKDKFYKEMPIGLAMSLGINEFAMDYYSQLDTTTKNKIKNYIQTSDTGNEAKQRINTAITNLEKHNLNFLD